MTQPRTDQVRLIYTDYPGGVMPEHRGKVFAVIGPFDSHMDKGLLQTALELCCKGWNSHGDSP